MPSMGTTTSVGDTSNRVTSDRASDRDGEYAYLAYFLPNDAAESLSDGGTEKKKRDDDY